MNNKIKGSFWAKILAWVGITLCAVIFAGSILGVVLMTQLTIYDKTEEEAWEAAAGIVCSKYAVMALANMEEPADDKYLDTYFRYGIIEGESIEGLDINSNSTYVERNFSEQVTEEDLFLIYREVGEDTIFYYTPSKGILGEYWMYEEPQDYTFSEACYGLVYDEDHGIFYYEASNTLYPVQHVEIDLLAAGEQINWYRYGFTYDFERRMYQNQGLQGIYYASHEEELAIAADQPVGDIEIMDRSETPVIDEVDGIESEAFTEEVWHILEQEYLTFDMLEHVGTQGRLAIADTGVFSGEIVRVQSGYLAGKEVTTERDYMLVSDNILEIYHWSEAETKPYTVVCLLPEMEKVAEGRYGEVNREDFFVQAHTLVSLAYDLRYSIYGIMFAALAVGILCLVFLIAAAGHRKGKTEIVETAIDLLPLEIYIGLAGLLEFLLALILYECSYQLPEVPFLVLFVFVALCMFWLALVTLLSAAVRIKCRRFWKNTIVYRVISLLKQLLCGISENLPMLWKVIGLMLIIFGVEFINLLFILSSYVEFAVFFWFIEKAALLLLVCWCIQQMQKLQKGGQRIAEGDLSHRVDTGKLYGAFRTHGENLNSISNGISHAVDERLKSERFKTELITNVSHDIKTPLTSIINYVDLLEKEDLQNETVTEYLEVLDRQSNRLKKLIEDLMEASKASTGNLAVNLERLEAGVFLVQTVGEYEEKTGEKDLELLIRKPEEPIYVMADGRHLWRVIDNLMNNILKYAQPGTRVYINMEVRGEKTYLIFRNTSKYPLNISSEELMERFVRGDASRNTEGSGLGLSIAKSLIELMGGSFALYVDGDLFKVEIGFDMILN